MKIGLVVYGSLETMSGGNLYDRKLIDYLRSRGDQVRIIALPPGDYPSHLFNNLDFRLSPDLDLIIEDELVHPSVLVANWRHSADPSRSKPALLSLVHNLHSSERRAAWQNAFYRQVEKLHLRSVDGYIFNSQATRDSVATLAGDDKPSVLAPPGGDRLGSISESDLQERLARGGPLRLLFLANVTPLKGLHVLLDALRCVSAHIYTLEVAGSLSVAPGYAASMQQQAGQLGMPVKFHGILDGEELAALLKNSDALALPSFWEGFGIAYLEGMAFGLPAIGTTAGAIPQMIKHGSNGYLIAPGDSLMLADLIKELASDRARLEQMSSAAREYFGSCITWAQSAEIVRNFLIEIIGRS